MMFRPKYCCNCGEKVQRTEWRLWTSRRFCDLCSTEFKHIDLIPFAAVGLGLLFGVFGFSGIVGGSSGPNEIVKNPASKSDRQLKPPSNVTISPTVNTVNATPTKRSTQNIEQPGKKENSSEDAVFYCGALTKKGTACTRRVKAKGYCWQHSKAGQIRPTRF